MARLLVVADDSQLLTEIYPLLAPMGFAVIETITSATTALRLLHRTPHQYAVLAQDTPHCGRRETDRSSSRTATRNPPTACHRQPGVWRCAGYDHDQKPPMD
jgi:hypothetical protein